MIKCCLAAAVILLPSRDALADTISFSVPVAGAWAEFPEGNTVAVPGFNTALGRLTGVTDILTGTGFESLTGYGPIPGPFDAAVTEQIDQIGPSGRQSFTAKPFSIAAGPTGFSTGFGIDATFTAPPLNYSGQTVFYAFLLDFTAIDETTGFPLHGSSALDYRATLTETFTYTPVPEPGSFVLLATTGILLASLAHAANGRETCREPRRRKMPR